ncbi:MAG TPA: BtaA family protein [Planctomycetota bacterium]|nr:BtaA family protein [Planctomycetota bacterium]
MIQAISTLPKAREKREGSTHGKFFDSLLKHHLIFNTSWEDPALDRVALKLTSEDRLLSITGAGCNVLDYLLAGAGEVHAVDLNPCQNALLELKAAAIRSLPYDVFFELFGLGRSARAEEMYRDALRPHLREFAQAWWDKRIDFFKVGKRWHHSFFYRGTSGFAVKLMVGLVRSLRKAWGSVETLLAARDVNEQREVYESRLRDRIWTPWMKWFLSQQPTLSLIGIPRGQHEEMLARYPGGAADYIRECFETVITRLPFQDNYFWRVYIRGHYTPECCPEYLKRKNFEKLRGLLPRLRINTMSLTDYMQQSDTRFTRFVLLDHMDWLRGKLRAALADEWSMILERSTPGARVIYRSAACTTPWLDSLAVRHEGRERILGDFFTRHPEISEPLHARDRVHTYGSFHVVDLPG